MEDNSASTSFLFGESTLDAINVAERAERNYLKLCHGEKTINVEKQDFGSHEYLLKEQNKSNMNHIFGAPKIDEIQCHPKITGKLKHNVEMTIQKETLQLLSHKLNEYGLPFGIVQKYEEMGLKNMFQWQVECLSNNSVLSGKNLIYSAPTSAGKTLVAEILMIKNVLERKKKAIIILPFVSVVKEKTKYFQALLEGTGMRVEGFMGGYSPVGGFQQTDLAICTIERANSLINRLMEDGTLDAVGIIVVDELHLLGDSHRGYLLELLLTKIQYMCFREKILIQIVGMSATLPNLELLANWLHSELYQTDFRPVPLKEYIKLGKIMYDHNMEEVYRVNFSLSIKGDPDDMTFLCLETIAQGFSVLVFCPTKNWCEKLAESIAKDFYYIGTLPISVEKEDTEVIDKFICELNKAPLTQVLEDLKKSPVGLDPILAKTVLLGVAFHHAGLTVDERDILETSFRSGLIRVLIATSTLSSGVNLPARRVIVRTPLFHGKLVDVLTYRQMSGRAGRMGVDTAGESILICHEKERGMVERLLNASLPPLESCLGSKSSAKVSLGLKRAVFEVVASGVAITPEEVESYCSFTLLAASMKREKASDCHFIEPLKLCLKYLEENEFIRLLITKDDGAMRYIATQLGEACLAASLPPDQGLSLFEELQRARKCFILEDELHIIYQVTPFSVADQWGDTLDWLHLLNMWESLPETMRRVGELVGVEERFIVRAMRGTLNLKAPKQLEKVAVHRRFYTALALRELVNEVPLSDVAQKYGCSRGMLQSLQQSAAVFASMVTQFCRRLRWSSLELLASQFQDRLQFGIRGELCDLMRLPMLDGQCARALFDAGIETLVMLATDTSPEKIDKALRAIIPFQSEKNKESNANIAKRKWIFSLSSVRNLLGKNAAMYLIEDARKLIQKDLGIASVKWKEFPEEESKKKDLTLGGIPVNEVMTDISQAGSNMEDLKTVDSIGNENLEGNQTDFVALEKDAPPGKISVLLADEAKQGHIHGDLNSFKQMIMEDKKRESKINEGSFQCEAGGNLLTDNQISPSTIVSSSPIIEFAVNHSGREINDSSGAKRNSFDIFSSTVCEQTATNMGDQSSSLFGDSFSMDASLGNLLDGISNPNRMQFSSSPNVIVSSSSPCDQSFTNNVSPSLRIIPVASHNINKNHKQLLTQLDFSHSDLRNKPLLPPVFSEKVDYLDIAIEKKLDAPRAADLDLELKIEEDDCDKVLDYRSAEIGYKGSKGDSEEYETNSPDMSNAERVSRMASKWHFGSMIEVEEDHHNVVSFNINNIEILKDGQEDYSKPVVFKHSMNEKRLSFEAMDNSFLEKAFTTVFDFEENVTLRVTGSCVEENRENDLFHDHKNGNDGEEGWQGHDCTMEGVHHSIIGPSSSEDEGDASMILSSQEFYNSHDLLKEPFCGFTRSFSDRTVLKNEQLSVIMPKKEEFGCHAYTPTPEELPTTNREGIGSNIHNTSKSKKFRHGGLNLDVPDHLSDKINPGYSHLMENKKLKIIYVSKDLNTYECFCREFESQRKFSFAVAVSHSEQVGRPDSRVSRSRDHGRKMSRKRKTKEEFEDAKGLVLGIGGWMNVTVEGISMVWDGEQSNAYFMSLKSNQYSDKCGIPSHNEKIAFLKKIFHTAESRNRICIAVHLKEHLRALCVAYDINTARKSNLWDPKVADWLLDPDGKEKSLQNLCMAHCPEVWELLRCDGNRIQGSMGLDGSSSISPDLRSSLEALVALRSMSSLERSLQEQNLFHVFADFEMPAVCCLVQMEAFGIGFSDSKGSQMKSILESKMIELEKKAYILAGHPFRISSPKEVGKVLYQELRLPCINAKMKYRGRNKWSSNKEAMERLASVHLLPSVVMEWRKLSAILTKTIQPLLQSCHENRIHGAHLTHTSTGRISMYEPNLQNIPRDFEIMPFISNDKLPESNELSEEGSSANGGTLLSIRRCFLPSKGFLFLSADYSQLELRIIAHLSQDDKLCSIFNKGIDVFCEIASVWKGIDAAKVTSSLRQQAKRICYGMLYGIGYKNLAEQLGVDENEASNFMETFKNSFPGLKAFLITTVQKCRSEGHVWTMKGRRRELVKINDSSPAQRAHAERQAVNTIVQGSAADLVKSAMVQIDKKLCTMFPPCGFRKASQCSPTTPHKRSKRCEGIGHSIDCPPSGAMLVLHLHDELVYEVASNDLERVVQVVKAEMEGVWKLSVDLPVKVKVGESWGTLVKYETWNN